MQNVFETLFQCYLRFQATYNYVPRNEDELELKEGDIVDVIEKCDDGWFVGKVFIKVLQHCCKQHLICMWYLLVLLKYNCCINVAHSGQELKQNICKNREHVLTFI